ncbi:MAG: hypothetical protein AMXMBFR84_46510 [Candidatus Hydrogenedentota bacterium]
MNAPYTVLHQLGTQVEVPPDGILSRTLLATEGIRVVLFAFSAGQTLSDHTSPMEAVMHFLQGEAEVTLGEQKVTAQAGTWIRMEPGLKHAIAVHTSCVMELILVK